MNSKSNYTLPSSGKKAYQSPKLHVLGNVRKLTLKIGSNTDGFGATFSG
ncbi:hypothetical protein [Spirosoma sp.]|nr:hypothetical protein [Spirosoma sp.]MBN8827065.1 hypothetical protein [Spirosoma sp.]